MKLLRIKAINEILKITVKFAAIWNVLSCTVVDMDSYFKGTVGQDSSVGIANHYRIDSLGLVGIFSACVQPALAPTQPPEQGVLVFSARGKVARHGVDHPPLPLPRNPAKERVPALPLCTFMASYKTKFYPDFNATCCLYNKTVPPSLSRLSFFYFHICILFFL